MSRPNCVPMMMDGPQQAKTIVSNPKYIINQDTISVLSTNHIRAKATYYKNQNIRRMFNPSVDFMTFVLVTTATELNRFCFYTEL